MPRFSAQYKQKIQSKWAFVIQFKHRGCQAREWLVDFGPRPLTATDSGFLALVSFSFGHCIVQPTLV